MAKVRIVQVGKQNWADAVELPADVEWFFTDQSSIEFLLEDWQVQGLIWDEASELPKPKKPFQLTALVVSETLSENTIEVFKQWLDPYSIFLDQGVEITEQQENGLVRSMCPQTLPQLDQASEKVLFLVKNLFSGQYGEKLKVADIDIHPQFTGTVEYDGNIGIEFEGNFGQDFAPLFTFRYNIMAAEKLIEIWPEFEKQSNTSLRLEISTIRKGSISDVMDRRYLEEWDLAEPVQLPDLEGAGYYTLTFYVKGQGRVKFGPCHWRFSRSGLGRFILGGQRMADGRRQEIFSYFHPGDLKPPLNVYFSGYRSAEGFEGFYMMKNLGCPFLLLADPRLEGGCFYSGSKELEEQIVETIQATLDYLGFSRQELILSGLSMGAYGGLYYSAALEPHAVIVGKPFTDLGDVVTNLKLRRPDEFETSIDMLRNVVGHSAKEPIKEFNLRFWEKIALANLKDTRYAIAYMEHDDYDPLATIRLIDFFAEDEVHIFTKGYEGRHNDNSFSINKWFLTQYNRILSHDFGRS